VQYALQNVKHKISVGSGVCFPPRFLCIYQAKHECPWYNYSPNRNFFLLSYCYIGNQISCDCGIQYYWIKSWIFTVVYKEGHTVIYCSNGYDIICIYLVLDVVPALSCREVSTYYRILICHCYLMTWKVSCTMFTSSDRVTYFAAAVSCKTMCEKGAQKVYSSIDYIFVTRDMKHERALQ